MESFFKWPPVVGNCQEVSDFLTTKTSVFWLTIRFIDALLRGFGQVILANNPLSGLIFLVALAANYPNHAIMGLAGAVLSLLWAVITKHDGKIISAGITTYNGILVGIFTYNHCPYFWEVFRFKLFLAFVFGVLLSVYLTSALNGLLSQWNTSCLTLPFIIVLYLLMLSVYSEENCRNKLLFTLETKTNTSSEKFIWSFENVTSQVSAEPQAITSSTISNIQNSQEKLYKSTNVTNESVRLEANFINTADDHLKWGKLFTGILLSASQLVAVESVSLSCAIFLALIIYSPTTFSFAVIGSMFGTVTAYILISSEATNNVEMTSSLQTLYTGVWGYNGLLTAGILAGNVWILTKQTALASLFAVAFATGIQYGLSRSVYRNSALSMYNLPFNLSVITFICLSILMRDVFHRPDTLSFPERQKLEFRSNYRTNITSLDDNFNQAESGTLAKKRTNEKAEQHHNDDEKSKLCSLEARG